MTLLFAFLAGWLARSAFVAAGVGSERGSWGSVLVVVALFAAALFLALAWEGIYR